MGFYNTERSHSSLDGQTPPEAYGAGRPVDMWISLTAYPHIHGLNNSSRT